MKPTPKLGGLELHPLADLALPLLLNLAATVTVAVLASAVHGWAGIGPLPLLWLVALLFAMESTVFTTVFTVREVDVPDALRWVELALMGLLAKLIATLPHAAGLVDAVTGGWAVPAVWLNFLLIAYGWLMGMLNARTVQYLHPGVVQSAAQDFMARNDHAEAFGKVREQALWQVLGVGALLGIGSLIAGDTRVSYFSWLGFGLLVIAALGAGAVLVAARLRAEITWLQERVEVSPAVFARWAPAGLSLLLVPALLALCLPGGPRLPIEWLLALLNRGGPRIELPPDTGPKAEAPKPQLPPELLQEMQKGGVRWQIHIPVWFWYALGALFVLWVLYRAARQLAERSGELKGFLAILAVVAAWYLAFFRAIAELIGPVLRQAVTTPAEALSGLFSEAGAVGRYLPHVSRAPGEPRAALRYYFARLQTEAGRKGLKRGAGVTAAEYGRRLAEAAPERAGEIDELTAAYSVARYSDLPVDGEKVSFARRAWVAIARALTRR